jgi:hypothetical protein
MPCGIPLQVVRGGFSGRCERRIIKVFNLLQKSNLPGGSNAFALRKALRECRDRFSLNLRGDKTDRFGNWGSVPTYEKAISETLHKNDFDLIYSTGGPAAVHIAVAHVLDEAQIPWIAEIQDPLLVEGVDGPTYNPSKRDLDYLYLAEECLKKADAVICLTEACAQHYRDRLKKKSVYTLYPGSSVRCNPSRGLKEAGRTSGTINMFHGGTLAGNRNLDVLLRVIRDEGLDGEIVLTLAGYIDNEVREQMTSTPFVRYLGVLSRDETVRQIYCSDICLVVQNQSPISRYTIPSKFYEYTALSLPILFLGYNNDEVRRNSSIYNFYYCDQGDPKEVSECLRQVSFDYHCGRLRIPVDPDITKAADQFVKLCREISG